jgi:hypothetical protein
MPALVSSIADPFHVYNRFPITGSSDHGSPNDLNRAAQESPRLNLSS